MYTCMYEFWWINVYWLSKHSSGTHFPRQTKIIHVACPYTAQNHHHHTEEHTINGVTPGVEVINARQRVETREERAENQHYIEVLSIKNSFTFN